MIITKRGADKDKLEELEQLRAKANEGCSVCPICGETHAYNSERINGLHKQTGLLKQFHSREVLEWFTWKKVDYYFCYTCGSEWTSEPYKFK